MAADQKNSILQKKLKKAILHLEKGRKEPGAGQLLEELNKRQIDVEFRSIDERDREETGILVITDQQETIDKARLFGLPCIGYEKEEQVRLKRVSWILLGLEELESGYLEGVYRREKGIPWIVGSSKRLFLRESVMEDLGDFYGLYEAPGMKCYIPQLEEDWETEQEHLKSYIHNMYPFYGYGLWSVIEKETGELVGRVGLENEEYQGATVVELGYMIAPKVQNIGYGYEAAMCAIRYGFGVLELSCLYLFCNRENTASVRLAKKLGFQKTTPDKEVEGEVLQAYFLKKADFM